MHHSKKIYTTKCNICLEEYKSFDNIVLHFDTKQEAEDYISDDEDWIYIDHKHQYCKDCAMHTYDDDDNELIKNVKTGEILHEV